MSLPTRRLGLEGPEVSLLGLGCNSMGLVPDDEARRIVHAAIEGGITLFDTAEVYAGGRSEETLGRYLPADRQGLTVITKLGHPSSVQPGLAPCAEAQVVRAIEGSLRRLKCERLDVVLLHFPDPLTPFAETVSALGRLIAEGKLAHWGVSNFTAAQLGDLVVAADGLGVPRPVVVQDEFSLIRRSAASSTLPAAVSYSMGFVPFFPLAGGLLAGRYDLDASAAAPIREQAVRRFRERFLNAATLRKVRRLREVCLRAEAPMTRVALAWLARHAAVSSIIAGASSASQVRSNISDLAAPVADALLEAAERATSELSE